MLNAKKNWKAWLAIGALLECIEPSLNKVTVLVLDGVQLYS